MGKMDKRNKKRYAAGHKLRSPNRLMRDTSQLLRSLTHHVSASLAQIGTNMPYAVHHQYGTKKMVARPIFGISNRDRADLLDLLQDFVLQQWA